MSARLVLLVGPSGSGKNTLADALSAQAPGTVQVQLAAPIKAFLREVFGWTCEHTDGALKEVVQQDMSWGKPPPGYFERFVRNLPWKDDATGTAAEVGLRAWWRVGQEQERRISPREAMQEIGTGWGRAHDEGVWARLLLRECLGHLRAGVPRVIVTDGRFENEVQVFRDAGAFVVGLRDESSIARHVSEHEPRLLVRRQPQLFDVVLPGVNGELDNFMRRALVPLRPYFSPATAADFTVLREWLAARAEEASRERGGIYSWWAAQLDKHRPDLALRGHILSDSAENFENLLRALRGC